MNTIFGEVKVYYNISEFKGSGPNVVTIGTFDGVHLGHIRVLEHLIATGSKCAGETVILTFSPHPRMVLFPNTEQVLLNTIDEKVLLLEKLGIDHLIIHPFTREFSMLSSEEFITDVIVDGLKTSHLVIGYDHHFGKDREGSFLNLKKSALEYGFQVEEIPAWETDHIKVSSTRIRKALDEGQVEVANLLLGYEYSLNGTVVKGRQLGRQLGFPTANIICNDSSKLIPANGVYAVRAKYNGKEFAGMMNIGVRPTVNGMGRTVEVNIFDFNGDIYGERLEVKFVKWVRAEQKFDGIEKLKEQLNLDMKVVKEILGHV